MFKLMPSRETPSYRGVGPPVSQLASYPLLPAGTKPIFELKERGTRLALTGPSSYE